MLAGDVHAVRSSAIALAAFGERVREPGSYRWGSRRFNSQTPAADCVDDLGVSGGSETGAAAVSGPAVVDEAPLVAVRADGDVFAS